MALTSSDVRALVAAFEASDWDEMSLSVDGTRVELTKSGRPPGGSAAPAVEPPPHQGRALSPGTRLPAEVEAGAVGSPAVVAPVPAVEAAERQSETMLEPLTALHRIHSPTVGVFWRSPEPDAPPFVGVGSRVEPDTPVCIVEVMKLFNHVQAGVSGTVRAVEGVNGEMVEHGQTLFVVELDPAG
jgi:acetyl-CoA carboxylase biotin carboxyl carrier protein